MNFTEVNNEIKNHIFNAIQEQISKNNIQISPFERDIITERESLLYRLKKINNLYTYTKRNTICYFSAWVQKPINNPEAIINDNDINGFMNAIQGMDQEKGLDLIIHTPGGSVTAAENIVTYLKKIFKKDIRVIVPHLAMSAGTMIACASKEIIMGKQSSLGPIDPQYKNIPTQGVIKEFEQAISDVVNAPNKSLIWREIIKQYRPTFVDECRNIVSMSNDMVRQWLNDNMFVDDSNASERINVIMKELSEHDSSKVHDRHYDYESCKKLGLNVKPMEDEQMLQDLILEIYHSYVASTYLLPKSIKFIESQDNRTFVISI